jgi:hypothetical protein
MKSLQKFCEFDGSDLHFFADRHFGRLPSEECFERVKQVKQKEREMEAMPGCMAGAPPILP